MTYVQVYYLVHLHYTNVHLTRTRNMATMVNNRGCEKNQNMESRQLLQIVKLAISTDLNELTF